MHALASIGAGIAPGHLHLSISLLPCSHPGRGFHGDLLHKVLKVELKELKDESL
jgi:hypothetical protein